MRNPTYLLLTPPITDPTSPYHSLSYLVGHARGHGYDAGIVKDLNIDFLNWLSDPAQVGALLQDALKIQAETDAKTAPTRLEQLHYRIALRASEIQAHHVAEAIRVLQDEDSFFDYDLYLAAVGVIETWMELLSLKGLPYQFAGFNFNLHCGANMNASEQIADPAFLSAVNGPFEAAYDACLKPLLEAREIDLIGVSINYISQLPFALYLLKKCREYKPDAMIIAGGTEVSDIVKYAKSTQAVETIFRECDGLVVGEGETAFVSILDAVASNDSPAFPQGPGLMPLPARGKPVPVNENLRTLNPPDYSVNDLSAYWSPAPVHLYSPTRGCYWNQCTFCDYGLNFDMPTSPSRETPVEQVVADLTALSQKSPYVYLAVDAISPRFLKRFSAAIIEAGITVKWSAELRLEPRLSQQELAGTLAEAGCVAISFGFESGSQRVLDMISKGVSLEAVPGVLEALDEAGIGTQMMAFTGFPGETPQEARATYDFLQHHASRWTLAFVGEFGLTEGAIIAKQPDRFGISRIYPAAGDDVPRQLLWEAADGEVRDRQSVLGIGRPELPENMKRFALDRPWVGGIDSAHSILYFSRNSAGLVDDHRAEKRGNVSFFGYRKEFPDRADSRLDRFVCRSDVKAFVSTRGDGGRRKSLDDLRQWYAGKGSFEADGLSKKGAYAL